MKRTLRLALILCMFIWHADARAQSCNWINNVIDGADLGDNCPCAIYQHYGNDLCVYDSWKLVFQDEFSENALNTEKWVTWGPTTPDGLPSTLESRASPGCQQIYKDENVVQDGDGTLALLTKQESFTWFGTTRPYTSGMIWSRVPYTKGRFEIRCKLPGTSNSDLLWPAFWGWGPTPAHPEVGASEIDVFEFCGSDWSKVKTNLHRNLYCYDHEPVSRAVTYDSGTDYSDGFHVFATEWDPFYVKWYVDGTLIRSFCPLVTVAGNSVGADNCGTNAIGQGSYWWNPIFPEPNAQLSIIANTAVANPESVDNGTFCDGGEDMTPADFPAEYEIDYIRVYQRTPQAGATNLCTQQRIVNGDYFTLCEGSTRTYQVSGCHGDLQWETSPNIQIMQANAAEVTVTNTSPLQGGMGWVRAIDLDGPCTVPGQQYELDVWVGPPIFTVTSTVPQCGSSFDLMCDSEQNAVCGVEYTFTVNGALAQGPGYSWLLNDHPAPPNVDWCYDYEIVGTNWLCGPTTVQGTVRDNCVYGPCNLLQPGGFDGMAPYIHVAPVPADTKFTIDIGKEIALEVLQSIEVRDAMGYQKFSKQNPGSPTYEVDCASWPPGVYYVTVTVKNQEVMTKLEIK